MSLNRTRALMRMQAILANGGKLYLREGLVSAYDADGYRAKVLLQPSGKETGFLEIATLYAGAGFGLIAPPVTGAQVMVAFTDADPKAGVIIGMIFGDEDLPPDGGEADEGGGGPVQPGELLIKHKDGALLHMFAGGVVGVTAPGGFKVNGDTAITGNLTVTADITDQIEGGNTKTVKDLRDGYNAHKHSGVQAGPAKTAITDHPVDG